MTERAQKMMDSIWESRNQGADTENKLVASILRIVSENVIDYTAQNGGLIVLDKNDMVNLAGEIEAL
jgi:hypothetical protein